MKTVQNFNPTVITGQKSDTNFNPSIIGSGKFNKEYILQKYKDVDFKSPTAPAVYKKAVMLNRYEKGGFSTLEYESQNAADTIKRIFGGWQTAEDMDKAKPEVEKMYEKLKSFATYNTDFGDGSVDLTDTLDAYKLVLDNWDKQKEEYAKFKNAKEYDEAVKKNRLDNTFRVKTGTNKETGEDEYRGLTYDEVQSKLKVYKEGSDEYEYLSTYVNFTDIAEFDKAIKNTNDENYKASLKAAKSDFNIKNLVYIDYGHYIENEDFTEKSSCNSEFAENDSRYAYINNYNGARAKQKDTDYTYDNLVLDAPTLAWGVTHWYDDEEIGWMSDVEIKVYNYLYATEGKEAAEKFLDETLISRSKRHYDNSMTYAVEAAEETPILASIASIPAKLTGGIKGLGAPNPYHVSRAEGNAANIILQTVGDEIAEATEGWDVLGVNVPSFAYSTAMSMADSGARRLVLPPDPIVQKVGSTFFAASSAYQQKELELTEAGEDEATVFWVSALSAAAEAVFEYVAIDKLFKIKGIDNIKFSLKAALKQAGVEATEEILTELANMINDTVIRGDTSELMQYYYQLEQEGYSRGEIATKLGLRVGGRLLEAGAGGFASGGFYGGVQAISNYRYNNATGKIISTNGQVNSLFDTAKGLGDADVNKLLDSYESNRKGNKLSNAQIGTLFSAVYEKAQSVLNSKKSTAEQKASAATVEGSLRNMLLQKNGAIHTEINHEILANSNILTDEERELVNTPDSELTAEQRAEKQEVLEKVMEEVVKSYQNAPENGETSGIEILSVTQKNNKRRHTTAKEQEFIKRVAKALDVKVEFTQITADLLRSYGYDFKDGDILPDGFYDRNTKTVHIGYTVYNPITFILKHELTHFGEGTAQYKKFVEIVKKSKAFRNWLETKTKDFREWNSVQANTNGKIEVRDLETIYLTKIARERGYKLQKDGVLSESDRNELHCEMIADFVGDCIFTGDIKKLENMLSGLDYKERNIVVRYILDFISYLKKKLAGNKEIVLEISRLEDAFNRMLSEAVDTNKETPTESGGDLQFSIKTDVGGNKFVDIQQDLIDINNGRSIAQNIAIVISEKFNNLLLVNGQYFRLNSKTNSEFTGSDWALALKSEHPDWFNDKIQTLAYADEILKAAQGWINETPKHPRKDKIRSFGHGEILYRVGKNGYSAEIIVGLKEDGSAVLYDIINIDSKKIVDNDSVGKEKNLSGTEVSTANTLSQKSSTVNSKNTQESGNNSKNNLQFSFARVQDDALISEAESKEKELLHQGKAPDIVRMKIWDDYGIIRDSAGEWIYEIDDSEMEFLHLGNAVTENPEIMELYKLENAKRLSKEKGERLNSLRKKYGYSILRSGKLSDFVKHPKLFDIFPQLKDIKFQVRDLKGNTGGYYDNKSKTLVLDLQLLVDIQEVESGRKSIEDFDEDPYIVAKKVVIHELQHALQWLEDREHGASEEYWIKRFERNGEQPIKPDTGEKLSPKKAYVFTKGEYEARVTADRLNMTEGKRRDLFNTPWLGWGETISARETATANSSNASIPTNADYMSAIKDGDAKQIREIVDNAARVRGYSERLYHQTGADFTEFNTDNEVAGKFDWELPTGVFLKPSNTDIGLKGKKQMELFAKAENPLHFKDRAEAREFWSENIDGYREAAEEVERIDNEYREKDDDAIMELQSYMRQWKKENPNADKRDIYADAKYQKLADKESAIMDEWEAKSDKASLKAKRLINDFIAESGYDGIVIEHDADGKNRSTKSYIVFDSSQLKSAEPITYDNNGNVISLSKRFDQGKKDIRFSVPSVDSYTEEQYNSFGWVRANDVLSASEYETLLSRYADYKHNNDNYPITRFGEAVIHSSEHPDVIMYVKGKIESPEITKVVRIVADDSSDVSKIHERIIKDEYKQEPFPYKAITAMYGEEYIRLDRKRNNASFRQYTARQEGRGSQEGDTVSRSEQNGTGSQKQNNSISEAGLKRPAFSMPSETRMLLDMYENGEISKTEYQTAIDKYWDDTIAELGDSAWAEQLKLIKDNIKLHGRIKRQNEQLARRRSEISQEITAQREERATKQKNIEHIRKTVSRIDKMLRTNSNAKHVPEELKAEITQFVSVFVANDRSPFDKKDLRNIYLTYSDALREGAAEGMLTGLDEDVLRDLKILRDQLDGKTLRDLNYHETLLVRNIVDNFAQIIKWGNELFLAGKEYEYNEIGHRAMYELIDKKSKRENSFSKAIDSGVVYANMTPAYFFDELGGVFKTLFDDVVEAQNKWYRNVENAKTYIRQMKEKYHYSEWENDMFDFTTENGDKIRISREQAMLLYATAKREYGNDIQKAEHLFRGGVVIEPSPKKLKDIVKKFKTSDEKGRKRIAETFSDVVDSGAHRITPQDVLKVKRWLSAEQLEYADALVDYLSKDMAALGNETSLQLYGIRKYNEDYYIPYNSAQNFLYSQPGVSNEARLKHQSFTKNTVEGANNPLVLSDFSAVCADHINRMCMYNALTIPLENMNRIFNYGISGEGINTKNIKSEIERVYGESAVSYIKTFIEDMNGNVRTSQTDKAINRWISKFKKGAVFASASVVVQQPSAIIRAMAYIKPKYFTKTTLKFAERDYQQCVKYAPVAGIKEMGRFDTGVGTATTNWLLQETPHGIKNKVKALFSKDSTYRDDKMSYFAAKADEITWAHIWAAVKAEIADTTDLKVDSEEFFNACGKRFTEVINYTQVYDSTLSRSQMMRSKSTGAQMLTAFMSEPTVSLNLLMNAARKAKSGTKEGRHYAARAVAAFVGSVALNAFLKSFVTAARNDDEEETYLEKYTGEFISNFLSDVNPLSLIPFVKDVISIFEGYTVERADMNLFSDLAQSFETFMSDTKSGYEKFESIAGSLAAFLGLPVKNVLRDLRAVYNLCNDIFVTDKVDSAVNEEVDGYLEELSDNETYESLNEEDKEKLEKNITKTVRAVHEAELDKGKQDEFDELYAELRKSKKAYDKRRKELIKKGYTASEITDGVEIARIAYMKSIGVDVGDYLLYKIATSKKYADTDNSGGVTKKEKQAAVREMDIDDKIKDYFLKQHK